MPALNEGPQWQALRKTCPEPTNGSISRGNAPPLDTAWATAIRARAAWVKYR
jgi:hypothetical protein